MKWKYNKQNHKRQNYSYPSNIRLWYKMHSCLKKSMEWWIYFIQEYRSSKTFSPSIIQLSEIL